MEVKVTVTGYLDLEGSDLQAIKEATPEQAMQTLLAFGNDLRVKVTKIKEGEVEG